MLLYLPSQILIPSRMVTCGIRDKTDLSLFLDFFVWKGKKCSQLGIEDKSFGKYFIQLPSLTSGSTQGGPYLALVLIAHFVLQIAKQHSASLVVVK